LGPLTAVTRPAVACSIIPRERICTKRKPHGKAGIVPVLLISEISTQLLQCLTHRKHVNELSSAEITILLDNRLFIFPSRETLPLCDGRGMVHKIIALSHDKVENDRNFLSLFDELPRRRLELRFGKFSVPDFLDQNSVGSDRHLQLMNWTADNNGAWDYAADARGYAVGFTADYEDRNWGVRFAEGLMPKVANGIDLVWKFWQAHAENWEYAMRRGFIPHKPGVVRLLAYTNHANMNHSANQAE
jgi:hypothetical protein